MNQCDTSVINETRTRHEFNGDYRTKRLILEIYDAMQESIRTGQRDYSWTETLCEKNCYGSLIAI
jgi:hypothetical protein